MLLSGCTAARYYVCLSVSASWTAAFLLCLLPLQLLSMLPLLVCSEVSPRWLCWLGSKGVYCALRHPVRHCPAVAVGKWWTELTDHPGRSSGQIIRAFNDDMMIIHIIIIITALSSSLSIISKMIYNDFKVMMRSELGCIKTFGGSSGGSPHPLFSNPPPEHFFSRVWVLVAVCPGGQPQVPLGFLAVRLWPIVPLRGLQRRLKLCISLVLHQGALNLASAVHHLALLVIPSMKQAPSEAVRCTAVVASVAPGLAGAA